jgi:adhesin/invasin
MVYVADARNLAIRTVDPVNGAVATVAGTGRAGFNGDNQPATEANLNLPGGVWLHPDGRLFIADSLNNRVRVVCPEAGCVVPPPAAE